MKHFIKKELQQICLEIFKENKSIEEWGEVESSDMFQSETYNGGFDSIEEEFCFSVYIDDNEYWFQFSLAEASKIAFGEITHIKIRPAES